MKRHLRAIIVFVLVGCSSSNSTGGSSGTDTGADDAGADAPAVATVTPTTALAETLDIRVEAGDQGAGVNEVFFSNSYVYNVRATETDRCGVKKVSDSCIVRRCAGNGPLNLLDLGTIHVKAPELSWDLTPDGSKNYAPYQKTKSQLVAGKAFQVVVEGGQDLPGFTVDGALPAAPPALAAPLSGDALQRGQPVTFTWTPAAGTIELGVFQGTGAGTAKTVAEIRCHADGNAGTATIPAEATSLLEAATQTNYFYGAFQSYVVTIGSQKLTVSSFSYIPRMATLN